MNHNLIIAAYVREHTAYWKSHSSSSDGFRSSSEEERAARRTMIEEQVRQIAGDNAEVLALKRWVSVGMSAGLHDYLYEYKVFVQSRAEA